MKWGRQMVFVNHDYFYIWDPEWGPAFIKTNADAPWPIWIYPTATSGPSGSWTRPGSPMRPSTTASAPAEDPKRWRRTWDRFGSGAAQSFLWWWCHRLPSPFTGSDLRQGYTYELAFRQFEVSDTRVSTVPRPDGLCSRGCSATTSMGAARPGSHPLRATGQLSHPGSIPHQGHHPRRRPPAVLLLPLVASQAGFQGAQGGAHRAGDQRHPRLRDRPACHCRQLEGPLGRMAC
jgi:hypothetical protein